MMKNFNGNSKNVVNIGDYRGLTDGNLAQQPDVLTDESDTQNFVGPHIPTAEDIANAQNPPELRNASFDKMMAERNGETDKNPEKIAEEAQFAGETGVKTEVHLDAQNHLVAEVGDKTNFEEFLANEAKIPENEVKTYGANANYAANTENPDAAKFRENENEITKSVRKSDVLGEIREKNAAENREKEANAIRENLQKVGMETTDKNGNELNLGALRAKENGTEFAEKSAEFAKLNAENDEKAAQAEAKFHAKMVELKGKFDSGEINSYQLRALFRDGAADGFAKDGVKIQDILAEFQKMDGENGQEQAMADLAVDTRKMAMNSRAEKIANGELIDSEKLEPWQEEIRDTVLMTANKVNGRGEHSKNANKFGQLADKNMANILAEVIKLDKKHGGLWLNQSDTARRDYLNQQLSAIRQEKAEAFGKSLPENMSEAEKAEAQAQFAMSWFQARDVAKNQARHDTLYGKLQEKWGGFHTAPKVVIGAAATMLLMAPIGAVAGAIGATGLVSGVTAALFGKRLASIGKMKLSIDSQDTEQSKNKEKKGLEKVVANTVKNVLGWPPIASLRERFAQNREAKREAQFAKIENGDLKWDEISQKTREQYNMSDKKFAHDIAIMREIDPKIAQEYLNVINDRKRVEQSQTQKRAAWAGSMVGLAFGATAGTMIAGEVAQHVDFAKISENIKDALGYHPMSGTASADTVELGSNGHSHGIANALVENDNKTEEMNVSLNGKSDTFELPQKDLTAADIHNDYTDLANEKLPGSFGSGYDLTNADTAAHSFYDGLKSNPQQLGTYLNPDHGALFSADQLHSLGFNGNLQDPNAFADFLHNNPGKMADAINMLKDEMNNGKIETLDLDTSKVSVYDYGANQITDANGKIIDTKIVAGTRPPGEIIPAIKLTFVEHVMYVDSRCENLLSVGKPPVGIAISATPASPVDSIFAAATPEPAPQPVQEISRTPETPGTPVEQTPTPPPTTVETTPPPDNLDLKDSSQSALSRAGGGENMATVNHGAGNAGNPTGTTEEFKTTDGTATQPVGDGAVEATKPVITAEDAANNATNQANVNAAANTSAGTTPLKDQVLAQPADNGGQSAAAEAVSVAPKTQTEAVVGANTGDVNGAATDVVHVDQGTNSLS